MILEIFSFKNTLFYKLDKMFEIMVFEFCF